MHAITSECVMLTCELDRDDAPVHWYKDGQEIEESNFMLLEDDGPHHRLVLPAAQPPDGGEFQCVAGDERAYFTVTITGGGPGRRMEQKKVLPAPAWAAVTLLLLRPASLPQLVTCTPTHGLHPKFQSLQEMHCHKHAGRSYEYRNHREALPFSFS